MNKEILRRWILNRLADLSTKVTLINVSLNKNVFTPEEVDRLKSDILKTYGKMEMLRTIYDDFNLEDVKEEDLITL